MPSASRSASGPTPATSASTSSSSPGSRCRSRRSGSEFSAPGLTGGAIFYTFGIPYRLGAFFEFASVREFAPFINGMVVAGVVGTAITADLGARRIRDEIDAMEVLGVDPMRTLVLPRSWPARS